MKKCGKCKVKKEFRLFSKDKYKKDGMQNRCKSCQNVYYQGIKIRRRAYREENRSEILKYSRAYQISHKVELEAYRETSAYRLSRAKTLARYPNATKSRQYYRDHKENNINICSNCSSSSNVESHHNDYNKPMEVIHLCSICHKDWHYHNTPLNRVTGIFTEKKK